MAIKSDGKRRWVEVSVRLGGTPEQVWKAIATGPGMTAWFTPTTVEERVGGTIAFDFGGGVASSGSITAWDPERGRFAYEERGWSGEAPPIATEVTVTSASGDTCVVRMVHSLFTTSDAWDDEMEGFEKGWPGFFEVLDIYLRDFADQPAAAARAMAMAPGSTGATWAELARRLGLHAANLDEQRRAPAGVPSFAGTVRSVHQTADGCHALLRVVEPGDGIAMFGAFRSGDAVRVAACLFFYGPPATDTAARAEPAWAAWLSEHYPAT
jgi:uncharacterized protein YndB with AHSA1/START domain